MVENLNTLLANIRACKLCEGLPLGPNPILQASASSRVLIAGQAPGRITHAKGIPFDDPSGNRLRDWLGVTREQFYDPDLFAIMPMGFCFPGTAKGGDLPPRPLCAETWRKRLLAGIPNIQLTLVIGQYAQTWHLPEQHALNLTERVCAALPDAPAIPLPHPSPRNGMWLKQNLWFEKDILPNLKSRVKAALQ
jgi:uracil-DNA glycosylase